MKRAHLSKTKTGTLHIFYKIVPKGTWRSVCGNIIVTSVWPATQLEMKKTDMCKRCRMHYNPLAHDE